jgi:hypothetical protein
VLKACKHCGTVKSLDDFYTDRKARDGRRPECKACNLAIRKAKYADNPAPYIARVKKWQQENAERLNAYRREYRQRPERKAADREAHLRRKYGITLTEYDQMLHRQDGGCAVCGRKPNEISLHVDHDHATGRIRGLLCFRCNNALGDLGDSEDRLNSAAAYVGRDARLDARALTRAKALIA